MPVRPLKSFFPTADELLAADLPRLGQVLIVHLNSYNDQVKQHGRINRDYLLAMLENRNVGLGPLPPAPEYRDRQPEVTGAVMEAWDWLQQESMLMHAHQPGEWYTITRKGQELIKRFDRYERWEKLGVAQVKAALENTASESGGRRPGSSTDSLRLGADAGSPSDVAGRSASWLARRLVLHCGEPN